MGNNSIDINEALGQVRIYEENNMPFSAKQLWEKILENHSTEHRKFRYADTLRLCGLFLQSEKVFLEINVGEVQFEHLYYYHLYLGQLYADMGNTKQAKAQFITCMEFDNCDTVPYILLAGVLKPDRDNAEAIYYLEMALEKEGDIDEVYYNLATRFAIKGDMQKAMKLIEECLKLDPNYPNALDFKKDISNLLCTNTFIVV